jgi:DNA-binding MltR family transcriptional regulator
MSGNPEKPDLDGRVEENEMLEADPLVGETPVDTQRSAAIFASVYASLGRNPAEVRETLEFQKTLNKESDRGMALAAAAYLETVLGDMLREFFVDDQVRANELLQGTGALATFSARIELSYLLGLVPAKVRRDLHLMRKIRNEFAHSSKPLTFEDSRIAQRCLELETDAFDDRVTPRKKFSRVTHSVAGALEGIRRKIDRRVPMAFIPYDDPGWSAAAAILIAAFQRASREYDEQCQRMSTDRVD